jgi:hypothetical protein
MSGSTHGQSSANIMPETEELRIKMVDWCERAEKHHSAHDIPCGHADHPSKEAIRLDFLVYQHKCNSK